jgi:type II secretory pathway component PulM
MNVSDRLKRLLAGAALAAVLAVAFIGYLQPAFIVDLANRIALCF